MGIDAYLRHCRSRRMTDQTRRSKRNRLMRLEAAAGRPLLDLERADIVAIIEAHDHLAARSVYDLISTLSAYYAWTIREGLRADDPTATVDRPQLPRRLPRPIDTDDLAVALELADARMAAMLALAAFCGLRCMEIAGLDRADIAADALFIRGKGGRDRVVPLPDSVRARLRPVMPQSGPVFVSTVTGRRLRPATISQMVGQHLRGCGVDASAHQLRHWFGTEVYAATRDLRSTAKLMGHAHTQTTEGYAAWTLPDDVAGAVMGLGPKTAKAAAIP